MIRKIFLLFIIIFLAQSCSFAKIQELNVDKNIGSEGLVNIGNTLIPTEYPDSEKVAPIVDTETKNDEAFVIEGGIEKSVDITMEECLKLALGNNPRVRAAIEDIMASDARVGQVWSNYFPKLGWQTGYTRIRQLQLSDALGANLVFNYFVLGQISVDQMLYDFGVTQNQATVKKLEYEAAKANLTAVVNEVIYDTKDSYYSLLYSYDRKRVAEDNVRKYELFYNQAKAFYEIGLKPKVDVTIAEVNLSNAKLTLIQANNAIDLAVAKLNNTMGVPYFNRYNVQERLRYQPVDLTIEEAINIANESRPELKVAKLKVETANQSVKLVKKSYFPQLMVSGQYQIGGKSFTSNYGYNFGGYLNFPTVNGMLIKNQIKEAKALHDKEKALSESTHNNIYLEIQNAYLLLDEKKNQMPVVFLGVKQAKENYELSYGRYRVGEGSPNELKDAQVAYLNAQLNYYNALYQYNSAKAKLEKAVGKNLINDDDVIDFEG